MYESTRPCGGEVSVEGVDIHAPKRAEEVWADAIVGTRIRYSINEKWRVGLTADIGAGNANLEGAVPGDPHRRLQRPE